MNPRTVSQKDMQTLPAKARPAQDAGRVDDQSPYGEDGDAVMGIDSGFSNSITEEPGFKRNATWWVSML
jgi:hypothetical protein